MPEAATADPVFVPVEKARVQARVRARLVGGEPAPTKVGRYTLLARLGQGAQGIVYRAHDPQLERDVALKLVLAADPERVAAVLAEAHAMAKLAHPNVVSVYDAGEVDHAVYIAMEWVRGLTLGDWFGDTTRSGRETVRVMLDAGRGLDAAHAVGLVHQDFKPGNVMVGDDGRVRVLDFGLARGIADRSDDPRGTLPAGTPDYMAPEQRGGAAPTALSDQYAFCVTFHEALTHKRPATGALARGWLGLAKPIVARGLREDPSERHESIATLIRRFERRRVLALGAALGGAATLGAALMWALMS